MVLVLMSAQGTPLDQHGDHPHTNFRALYNSLTDADYYVEVLRMCNALSHATDVHLVSTHCRRTSHLLQREQLWSSHDCGPRG